MDQGRAQLATQIMLVIGSERHSSASSAPFPSHLLCHLEVWNNSKSLTFLKH
jgi:hypothetical protein